jgi:hypothetical protein
MPQDGSVDVSAQLAKMNKQIELWQQRVDALKAKMAEPGYNRAPESVRKAQSDKVSFHPCPCSCCVWLIITLNWF